MKKNQIEIIAAIYNGEKHIESNYNSLILAIKNANIHKYKIHYFNDGSTDNTIHILQKIAAKDKSLNIISNKNNIGVEKTRKLFKKIDINADWVYMPDIDDIISDDFFSDLIWAKNNKYEVVIKKTIEIRKNNEVKSKYYIEKKNKIVSYRFGLWSRIVSGKVFFENNNKISCELPFVSSLIGLKTFFSQKGCYKYSILSSSLTSSRMNKWTIDIFQSGELNYLNDFNVEQCRFMVLQMLSTAFLSAKYSKDNKFIKKYRLLLIKYKISIFKSYGLGFRRWILLVIFKIKLFNKIIKLVNPSR